ncbi:MAG: GGDEF domain-containing protein [Gemmatimonadota bacterium]
MQYPTPRDAFASDDPALRAEALRDLSLRARSGIPLYLVVWVIIGTWAHLPARAPALFYGNAAVLLGLGFARGLHYLRVVSARPHDTDRLIRSLILLLLTSALHWGLLAAWLIHHRAYGDLHTVIVVSLPAFAIGGASILGISAVVRHGYPALIFAPFVVATPFVGRPEHHLLVVLSILSLAYIHSAARIAGNDYLIALTNRLIAEERAARLDELSVTDALTGVGNRKHFDDQIHRDWSLCGRQGLPLTLMVVDLDHFKTLNDTHGHRFGDLCLRAVAGVLDAGTRRASDSVVRYGGDEFVVLLPGTHGEAAERMAQSFVDSITALQLQSGGQPVAITCSVGVSTQVPEIGKHPDLLLEAADQALYRAKAEGRNRWATRTEQGADRDATGSGRVKPRVRAI